MEFAHSRDDGFGSLAVRRHDEGGVLFRQFHKGARQVIPFRSLVDRNRNAHDRFREFDGIQDDGILTDADRITRAGVLKAGDGSDLACKECLDALALVRVHPEDSTDPLHAVPGGVVDV